MAKVREDVYEADNSVSGILLNDGKGEHTHVIERDTDTGRAETYKADDSVSGILLNDGKGELESVSESDEQ
jgi:hypothetical protein